MPAIATLGAVIESCTAAPAFETTMSAESPAAAPKATWSLTVSALNSVMGTSVATPAVNVTVDGYVGGVPSGASAGPLNTSAPAKSRTTLPSPSVACMRVTRNC
jgi:hypothetical protein